MDAIINPPNDSQSSSFNGGLEKSELMQFFEYQVNDIYWAYKDLLKEILKSDNQA
jgi:hypothetical protein